MLSVEQFVYRRADCYKARPGSLVLSGMEAIYLFNGYCQMPDDRVLQARELVRGLLALWAPRSPSMTPRIMCGYCRWTHLCRSPQAQLGRR